LSQGRQHKKRQKLTMRGAAVSVVQRLQDAGHVALFAGGCVRDMLMGKRPHDYDVATSATPGEVLPLFRRTQAVGASFGVVLVKIGRFTMEVATFRADADYEDGRHPTKVRFTNAEEDARRRDFTINGMFFDPLTRETVDYVGGMRDLEKGVIRAIGQPEQRFAEDHLRILRAIRFSSRLDFRIDRTTRDAMRTDAAAIRRISPERILDELCRMLMDASRARAFRDLRSIGVLEHLWPGAAALEPGSRRTLGVLAALPAASSFELAMAALLHTLSVEEVKGACAALRCSNYTTRTVTWLVSHQDALRKPADLTLADLKLLMAEPAFDELLRFFAAKLKAGKRAATPYRQILARARAIPRAEVAPPPLVNGHDLSKLGLAPGPRYKTILDDTYYAQLNGDIKTRADALAHARRLVDEAAEQ
jgi:poly(A) polymerase